jgi:hypothetical protein
VLTFGKRHSGESLPEKPGPEQQRALEAISVCDALWHYDSNMDSMLCERGLPPTRSGITEYLTGDRPQE